MGNGYFKLDMPENEPACSYLPGSEIGRAHV